MTAPRLAALALLVGLAPAARAQDAACPRDVLVARSMQRQALDRLEQSAGDDARSCAVWRAHVETMRRVAVVYGRCLTGAARSEGLGQVQESEREFTAAIRGRCAGR